MPNYVMDNIESFSVEKVSKGAVIWALHADKIPPHIGISVDGLFFSLKANGKDLAVPIENLLEIVTRRRIALLCFSLKDILSEQRMKEIFACYDKTIPNQVTCLNPIKTVLKQEQSDKLVELLSSLEKERRITHIYGLNIPANFFGIKDYNIADIHARLTLLNKSL